MSTPTTVPSPVLAKVAGILKLSQVGEVTLPPFVTDALGDCLTELEAFASLQVEADRLRVENGNVHAVASRMAAGINAKLGVPAVAFANRGAELTDTVTKDNFLEKFNAMTDPKERAEFMHRHQNLLN